MASDALLINPGHAPGVADVPIPYEHCGVLAPHQVQGVRFMWRNAVGLGSADEVSGGCILAHSMGLGKSLQVSCFIYAYLLNTPRSTVLLVMPTTVQQHWENEFDRWFVNPLAVKIYTLSSKDQKSVPKRAEQCAQWKSTGGVLLVGYEMLCSLINPPPAKTDKDPEKLKKLAAAQRQIHRLLCDPGPDVVVLDEGHRVKTKETSIFKAVTRIRTPRKIVLTGNPLQNNLTEYWCMVDIVRPGTLGPHEEFLALFEGPIKTGQRTDCGEREAWLARSRSFVLNRLIRPFLQRRDESVLRGVLPPKREFVVGCRMSDLQVALYAAFLEYHRGMCPAIAGGAGKEEERRAGLKCRHLLAAYALVVKLCNHPDVLRVALYPLDGPSPSPAPAPPARRPRRADGEGEGEGGGDEYDDGFDSDGSGGCKRGGGRGDTLDLGWARPVFEQFGLGESAPPNALGPDASGKISVCLDIVEAARRAGDRVLVFSGSIPSLDALERMLRRRDRERGGEPTVFFRLDGSTPQVDRQRRIDQFNSRNVTAHVFLISTRAGGLGVNLSGANRVVILDSSWNPCNDSQAAVRAWRIGQTKPVWVYRLLAAGTMEATIYSRQIAKEQLARTVVDGRAATRLFSLEELEAMFRFDREAAARTQPVGAEPAPEDPSIEDSVLRTVARRGWVREHSERDPLADGSAKEEKEGAGGGQEDGEEEGGEAESGLSPEEREKAWAEYELARRAYSANASASAGGGGGSAQGGGAKREAAKKKGDEEGAKKKRKKAEKEAPKKEEVKPAPPPATAKEEAGGPTPAWMDLEMEMIREHQAAPRRWPF